MMESTIDISTDNMKRIVVHAMESIDRCCLMLPNDGSER
jgi:hypothetical protein